MAARTARLIVLTAVCGLAGAAQLAGRTPMARGASPQPSHATGLHAQAAAPSPRDAPARIVSLVPALTETLFALGAGSRIVGVSSYDVFPPEVASLPRVGALIDPDMERILSMRPDLVVVYGSQTDVQAQLTRAGIAYYSYRHAGLDGVFSAIRELGDVVGRPLDAQRMERRIRSDLEQVRARVQGRGRPRTLLVFERDPGALRGLFVSGGRGFLHEMLEIAGGMNVFADVAREAVQPSLETLLARAPDVILEVRATGLLAASDPARERRVWSALASAPAIRNGRIHFLQGEHLVVPGPRVADATRELARALHPEAFGGGRP